MANNRYSQVKAKRVTKGLAAGATGGGGSITVSDTAPAGPSAGDLWFDSTVLRTYVYYNDGSSSQWVLSNPVGLKGPTGAAGAAGSDGSSVSIYATIDDLPLTGNTAGDQAYVTAVNRFYIFNGTGWYSISLVNTNPNITSVADASSNTTPFTLSTDGSASVITITATDPEDVPLTYTYSVTGGSLSNGGGTTATVVQGTGSNTNKFTVTPSTTEAYAGTFSLTFTASDGINTATSANSFTLEFITIITDSKYTTLLATATDTSDNNNITDASTNNHTITVNGDAHAGTFSPYRSGGYSTYFDGTSGLRSPTATGTTLQGATTFTVEFWYNTKTVAAGNKVIWGSRSNTSNTNNDDTIGRIFQNGGTLYYNVNGSTVLNASSVISANTWYYIALVVDSGAVSLYLDGARIATGNYTSANGSDMISVGHTANTPQQYITDFRINTAAEYSGTSHTVPTEPLLNTSNTVFHLPTKGYLATDLTLTGSPFKTPFSPYNYDEYSAADHGGSVYFDGSGDYLQTANPLSLSGDFTVSAWVYPEGASKVQVIASPNLSPNNQFFIDANNFMGTYDGNSTHNALGFSVKRNAWNYLVWSRSGSSLNMYLNGEQSSNSPAVTNTYNLQYIGILQGANGPMQGYISDLQVKTTSTSAANAAPPTAPPSSTGTVFHIKGTDASIIDKSQGANLKLVGNTTGSTTQVKFASTKSMYFGGSGNHIDLGSAVIPTPYNEDYTFEFWVYMPSLAARQELISQYASSQAGRMLLNVNSDNTIDFFHDGLSNSRYISSSALIYSNNWYHIAVANLNGTRSLYVDGNLIGSISGTQDLYSGNTVIGMSPGLSYGFNGYIQDFRITKGLARYTANFTPPTASLEG
jgi:hypothetical protein